MDWVAMLASLDHDSGTPNEIAGMRVTNGSGIPPTPNLMPGLPPIVVDPVVYSLTNSNPIWSGGTCGTLGSDHQGFNFTFYTTYLLPVSDALNNSHFSLEFDLWPTGTMSASAPSASDATIKGMSTTLGATYYTNKGNSSNPCPSGGTNVCATVTVVALPRAPLVLMNLSGEVENLAGYGYRYTGEQQFYSFYVNLPNGPSAPTQSDPFQSGVNLVLESRSAFLNSTLGSTLNGSNGLPPSITNCFGSSAQITTQNAGSSDFTSIVGSFSADQVTTSCAMTLLGELEPRSANHTNGDPPMGGTYIFLNSVQAELLGLDGQALTLLPFQSPSTSPTGGPPTNDLGSAFGYIVGAFAFAYNALVTAANFIANLPGELKALGQLILGGLEQFLHGLEAAVQWLANALNFLVQLVLNAIKAAFAAVLAPIQSFLDSIVGSVVIPLIGIMYDNTVTNGGTGPGNLTAAEAIQADQTFDPSQNSIQFTPFDRLLFQISTSVAALAAFAAGMYAIDLFAETSVEASVPGAGTVIIEGAGQQLGEIAFTQVLTNILTTLAPAVAIGVLAGYLTGFLTGNYYNAVITPIGLAGSAATIAGYLLTLYFRSAGLVASLPSAPKLPSPLSYVLGAGFEFLGILITIGSVIVQQALGTSNPVFATVAYLLLFVATFFDGFGFSQMLFSLRAPGAQVEYPKLLTGAALVMGPVSAGYDVSQIVSLGSHV